MSTPEKPDPARGWRFVEKLLANDDLEPLDQTTDEEVERQMREQGVREPSRVPSADELLAKAAARAVEHATPPYVRSASMRTFRVRQRRTQWVTWVATAAIGGLIFTAWINRHDRDVAAHPSSIDGGANQNAPTPKELAGKLREDAYAACRAERWAECEGWLDEAKGLDPNGEVEKGVKETRKALADAKPQSD